MLFRSDALIPQDCLYTLITKHPDGNFEYQVIGSIISYLFGPDNPAKVIEKICDPAIRIISLTITEGGYSFDRVTGEFDPTTPSFAQDLKDSTNPVSAFGYIYEGLKKRKELGIPAEKAYDIVYAVSSKGAREAKHSPWEQLVGSRTTWVC